MKLHHLLLLALLQVSLSKAVSPFYSLGTIFNRLHAAMGHTILETVHTCTYSSVCPELEQLARSVIKEIQCAQDIRIYQQKSAPAFCIGNNLYLRDSDLPFYQEHPHALRFVITHELMHVEKFHTPKRLTGVISVMVLSGIASYYVADWTLPKAATIDPKHPNPEKKRDKNRAFLHFLLTFLGTTIGSKISSYVLAPWYRMQEFEADAEAKSVLSNHYTENEVQKGATEFLTNFGNFGKYGWRDRLFATHPHPRERLIRLGIDPKKIALESAQNFPHLFASWVNHLIEVAAHSSKNNPTTHDELQKRLGVLNKSLDAGINIASIDPEAARSVAHYLEKGDYKSLIETYKELFLNKPNFDLNRTEFLARVTNITNAIQNNLVPAYLAIVRP